MRSLVFSILLFLAGTATADVVQLTNGRRIEGKILERGERLLTIQVENGSIQLPRAQIATITVAPSPEDEYAERAAGVRMEDVASVEELAAWASRRGLIEKARHLRQLADGLRIEERFAEAQSRGTSGAFLLVAQWAREKRFSLDVRRAALEKARRLAPESSAVRDEIVLLEQDEQAAAKAEKPQPAKPIPVVVEKPIETQKRPEVEPEPEEATIILLRRGGRRLRKPRDPQLVEEEQPARTAPRTNPLPPAPNPPRVPGPQAPPLPSVPR